MIPIKELDDLINKYHNKEIKIIERDRMIKILLDFYGRHKDEK
jgi:hypothetical protein